MSTTRFILIVLMSLGTFSLTAAQEPRTREQQAEIDKLQNGIEDFFKRFNDSTVGPDQAFRTLVGNGPLKAKTDELTGLIDKASKLEGRYGRHTGHDAASVKNVGSDLVILRYLYKGERFPVVWHFYYYRPDNGAMPREWNLIEIRFDTNLDGLDR